MFVERFTLYLEEILLFSQLGIPRNILIQSNISKALMYINNKLRKYNKEQNITIKWIYITNATKMAL